MQSSIGNQYGLYMFIALTTYSMVVYIILRKLKQSRVETLLGVLLTFMCIILGSKTMTIIINNEPLDIRNVLSAGLNAFGGAISGISFVIFYVIIFKMDYKDYLLAYTLPMPLAYAIAKIGCYKAGCCYGIEYNGPFNITYGSSSIAPPGVNLFPVQLLETILNIIIFITMLILIKKKVANKYKFISTNLITCGIVKFLTDFLRYTHQSHIITINQIFCIITIIIAFLFLRILNKYLDKTYIRT